MMQNNNEVKIILLDDHPLYLEGLKFLINQSAIFNVVDCCHTYAELLLSLSMNSADITIMDLSSSLSEEETVSLVEKIHQEMPSMAMVALGENHEHQRLSKNLQPAVKGYFCKSLHPEKISMGLRHVWHQHLQDKTASPFNLSNIDEKNGTIPHRITAKEKRVLEYLHAGFTVTQTALRINRSVKTVSTQKRTAMRKLGLEKDRDIFRLDLSKV